MVRTAISIPATMNICTLFRLFRKNILKIQNKAIAAGNMYRNLSKVIHKSTNRLPKLQKKSNVHKNLSHLNKSFGFYFSDDLPLHCHRSGNPAGEKETNIKF